MSPELWPRIPDPVSFPRVSGDEPPATDWMADRRVFSPRERG